MNEEKAKHCMNCAYREGKGFNYSRCLRSGEYADLHRKYGGRGCDENFSGWKQRPSLFGGIIKLLRFWRKAC